MRYLIFDVLRHIVLLACYRSLTKTRRFAYACMRGDESRATMGPSFLSVFSTRQKNV